jgi:hypothetical protein
MPTTKETRIVFSNENHSCFLPEVKIVEGLTFVRLDPRDRTFFKFSTGHCIPQMGAASDDHRYLTTFFDSMVKARSDGCQTAFAKLQSELRDQEYQARRAELGPRAKCPRVYRERAVREDDEATVGSYLKIDLEHDTHGEHALHVIFGIKRTPLWIEAKVENMDFVTKCMTADYDLGRFAATRGRGKYFRSDE